MKLLLLCQHEDIGVNGLVVVTRLGGTVQVEEPQNCRGGWLDKQRARKEVQQHPVILTL